MMHDFAITDRDVVFWDLPVTFDLEAALDFIEHPHSGRFPYAWTPDAGARIGVMPLAGGADRIRWFDIDPCFVFHGVNAFRRRSEVVVDVCRLTSTFARGELLGGEASLAEVDDRPVGRRRRRVGAHRRRSRRPADTRSTASRA